MSEITIGPLTAADRADWQRLATGYRDFYESPTSQAEYQQAWDRLMGDETAEADPIFASGARIDGKLVGIAHYLFHTAIWAPKVCYLQDLFTNSQLRGRGIARTLINAVAQQARDNSAARYYWLTQAHNTVAHTLYDKVAVHNGFIRYDFRLYG